MATTRRLSEEQLYTKLRWEELPAEEYRTVELCKGYTVIEQLIGRWWKQRYVVNHDLFRAYELMNAAEEFVHFTPKDVVWESLAELPEKAQRRARAMSAHYPISIESFTNGVAQVTWQLQPDGFYFTDDDGFGMGPDDAITLYGFIDTKFEMLVKFQYIDDDPRRLAAMRREAEEIDHPPVTVELL